MLAWPVNVIFRPERLVSVDAADEGRGWTRSVAEGSRLTAVYSLNLILYAAPLTLAGFGISDGAETSAAFLTSLATNSAFLLVGTLLTFGTFHVGIVLSGASEGVIRSLRAVTYSTGVYLALAYTLVWYVATTPATSVAADLLIGLQADFLYYFIDWLGADLQLPGGRPEPVDPAGLSAAGQSALLLLALAGLYYLYVLYVGGRIGHGANPVQAGIATAFVLVSPVVYAVSIILFSLYA